MLDAVTWLLLEAPRTLFGVSFVVLFFLLVHWRRGHSPRPLLIGLAVTFALLLLSALVVTRREHAGRVLAAIEGELLRRQVAALRTSLSPEFRAGPWGAAEFVSRAEQWLEVVQPIWLQRTEFRVLDGGDAERFDLSVGYLAQARHEGFQQLVRAQWRMHFVRSHGRWQLSGIDPPRIENVQYDDWSDVPPR
jgi:hypothetical protein